MLRRAIYYPVKMRPCDFSEGLQQAMVSVRLKVRLPMSACLNVRASSMCMSPQPVNLRQARVISFLKDKFMNS